MPGLFFSRPGRTIAAVAILACVAFATSGFQSAVVSASQGGVAQQDRARAEKRVSDRIRTLLREADALAAQQSRLLTELKQLEADRQAKAADVAKVEKDLAETARVLGVPDGTVKARLHRARELLKRRTAARFAGERRSLE